MWFGDLGSVRSEIWFKGMGIAPSSIGACAWLRLAVEEVQTLLCTGLIAWLIARHARA